MAEKKTSLIAANKAVQLLAPHHGGLVGAKALVADQIREGQIRARAFQVWPSDYENVVEAFRDGPPKGTPEGWVQVLVATWFSTPCWNDDVADWRWRQGQFVITQDKRRLTRLLFNRVQFKRADIDKLVPKSGKVIASGRKWRVADWGPIGVALMKLAQTEALTPTSKLGPAQAAPTRYADATDLRRAVFSMVGTELEGDNARDVFTFIFDAISADWK